jgi:hypothetical protein
VLEGEEELVVELSGVDGAVVVAYYAGGEAKEFRIIGVSWMCFDPGEGLGGEVVSGVGDVLEGENLFAGFRGVGGGEEEWRRNQRGGEDGCAEEGGFEFGVAGEDGVRAGLVAVSVGRGDVEGVAGPPVVAHVAVAGEAFGALSSGSYEGLGGREAHQQQQALEVAFLGGFGCVVGGEEGLKPGLAGG